MPLAENCLNTANEFRHPVRTQFSAAFQRPAVRAVLSTARFLRMSESKNYFSGSSALTVFGGSELTRSGKSYSSSAPWTMLAS